MNPSELSADELRRELVTLALEWERRYGVSPAITSAVSEFDAALLVGHSPESFGRDCEGRTAVTRGTDFHHDGLRYQVKANRPSGKPGSPVTLVAKAKNYEWDRLIWLLYEREFGIREAWEWTVDDLDPPASPSEPAFGVAMRLAVEKFQDQVRKASLARHRVQSAWLTLRRSPGTVRGTVNSHAGLGYRVEFIAEAVTDDGRRHEQACVLFVAPHNPAAEFRSEVRCRLTCACSRRRGGRAAADPRRSAAHDG